MQVTYDVKYSGYVDRQQATIEKHKRLAKKKIPDHFDYEVVMLPQGHRIGTLNEDFAFESLPGDIFQLGNKYSDKLQAKVLDENGANQIMTMGCYGIGVSRVVAAAIEQNHDDKGIIFPVPIAPYKVIILNLGLKDEEISQAAEIIRLGNNGVGGSSG